MNNLIYWDSKPFNFYVEFAFNHFQQNFNNVAASFAAVGLRADEPPYGGAVSHFEIWDRWSSQKETFLINNDKNVALNTNYA